MKAPAIRIPLAIFFLTAAGMSASASYFHWLDDDMALAMSHWNGIAGWLSALAITLARKDIA